jgi:hypothetical protein
VLGRWHAVCEDAGVPVRHGETPSRQAERLARAEPSVAASAMTFARLVNKLYYAQDLQKHPDRPSNQGIREELGRMRRLLGTLSKQIKRSNSSTRQE